MAGGDLASIGQTTDPESVAGDATLVALAKRHRTLLGTIIVLLAAGLPIALVNGSLDVRDAVATAAAPTYIEGDDVKLSVDLAGTLRTTAGGSGGNPSGGFLDSVKVVRTSSDSIRSWFGSTAPTVGQKTMAASLPVAIASDQTAIATTGGIADSAQLRTGAKHVGRFAIDSLFVTNPVVSGTNDFIALNANAVPVRQVFNEDLNGVYSFTLVDAAGVAAANNFVCLFNLAASTDTAIVLVANANRYSNVAAATNNSLVMFRITTCTVGTLQATTAINEFTNGFTAATMEVRTGNPTATTAAAVFAWPACHAITAAGTTGCNGVNYELPFRLLLAPGEGVVFRQTVAGDTDERFTLTIVWGERN